MVRSSDRFLSPHAYMLTGELKFGAQVGENEPMSSRRPARSELDQIDGTSPWSGDAGGKCQQ